MVPKVSLLLATIISLVLEKMKNKGWFKKGHGKLRNQESYKNGGLKMKGRIFTEEWKKKISIALTGKKQSKLHKKHNSEGHKKTAKREKERYAWKGDEVGYDGLHKWVPKHLGKPDKCEHCKKNGFSSHQIHWANKSGEYKRELNDWIRLCIKCHAVYDGVPIKMRSKWVNQYGRATTKKL